MTDSPDRQLSPSPNPALLWAWLEQSPDLLALTDASGHIVWANERFVYGTGAGVEADLLRHAERAVPGGTELCLRGPLGTTLRVRAWVTSLANQRLWTLRDISAGHEPDARAPAISDRLATAQGFGRSDEPARPAHSMAAQLDLAAELADIVFWRHDFATDRLHYNDHGFTVLGIPYRADGLTLAEARSYTHPDDVPKLAAAAAQALLTGEPVDVQTRHRRSDGTWRDMLVRRVVVRNVAAEAVAFVGVSLDVTDQVEHSRRAEHLAQRLENAATAGRMGVWSSLTGAGGTEWNAQMHELFDMVGEAPPMTLADALFRCVHRDDAARVEQAIRAYLGADSGAFEIEFRTHHRNGGTRWIMLRADIGATVGTGTGTGTGDRRRLFGVAMDVTDRHKAAAALHAVSERSALIARSAGIGIWEATPDNAQAEWDAQMYRLRGLEPREGAPNRDERLALVHADDRGPLLDSLSNPIETANPAAYEFRVRLPDGGYRWLASRSAMLRDEHGNAVRRVGVNWDITDARSAERARQKALLAERESQAKSQFLSRMSHELRTPLNAVLGFTQLLQAEAQRSAPDGQFGKLGHIRAAGEHLLALIDDVLDLSALESGALQLDRQPVELATSVALVVPMVQALAAQHRVVLRVGPLAGTALADPARLQQALLNLLTNAIKCSRPLGEVVVESRVQGERILLRIHKAGRGMQPERLAHVFEPFNRLGIDSEGVEGVEGVEGIEGSGIGLTIARALVQGMGGNIAASSEPGQGTVFEVTLVTHRAEHFVDHTAEHFVEPMPEPEPAADAPSPAGPLPAPDAARAGRSGQLLYIEDNDVNVLLVEELVRSVSGLRIAAEATGAQGVERARSLQPDLILVDMQLPDFDGFEVLRRLRAQPQTAAIPCIALSANAMPEDIARGLAAGFDDYWTKPIRFKPFLEALERRFPLGHRA